MMNERVIGRVVAVAIKTAESGPMREVPHATAERGAGLAGGLRPAPRRGITLVSSVQWAELLRELGVELAWHTRRANVLIDAPRLGPLIGSRCRLGGATLKIHDETKPCQLMDQFHMGLRQALTPDCRGGVFGEVMEAGEIRVGDALVELRE